MKTNTAKSGQPALGASGQEHATRIADTTQRAAMKAAILRDWCVNVVPFEEYLSGPATAESLVASEGRGLDQPHLKPQGTTIAMVWATAMASRTVAPMMYLLRALHFFMVNSNLDDD